MMNLKKAKDPDPVCMPAQSVTQSCLTLCDLMDCSPPGSSVHEIFQARTLEWEWIAISFSRGFPDPGIKLVFSEATTLAGGFFTTSTTWEAPVVTMRFA